jgi:hypothetical protein
MMVSRYKYYHSLSSRAPLQPLSHSLKVLESAKRRYP